jgi:GTPase
MTRCGFVALLGVPNAGKSTLVNRLVGAKIAIVSPKVQTTRSRVTGILVEGDSQAIFADLPGVFAPKRRLDRAMVDAAWRGVADADATLLVVDAPRALKRGPEDDEEKIVFEGLAKRGLKVQLALNKIDVVAPHELLALAKRYAETGRVDDVFMVSAKTGDGCDALKAKLLARLPEGPFHFPADEISDLPARLLAAEVTREQVFRRLHKELPYSSAVETVTFEERPDGSARIEQTIHVAREGQRKIVIGAGGAMLKSIGQSARIELAQLLDRQVHLFLHVKVDPKWDERRDYFSAWGLEFEPK